MKAAIVPAYGPPDVVRIEDRPTPAPGAGEVLVRLVAATVSTADARIRAMNLPRGMGLFGRPAFGWRRPRRPILGTEGAGHIVATGPGVTRWRAGDAVIVFRGAKMGTHATHLVLPETAAIVAWPAELTAEEAAALSFGGTTALHYLRDRARLRSGEQVLVIGGAGTVGGAAVQIAAALGARVTATGRDDRLLGRGAVRLIDRHAEDPLGHGPFDVIVDTQGALSFARAIPALRPGGRHLMIAADLPQMLAALRRGPEGRRAVVGPAPERAEDLRTLAGMAAAGRFRPLIDSIVPLSRISQAHARVDSGAKCGSVVVTLPDRLESPDAEG